jgi:tetratricopeptide (TPR) repeat protein
LGIAFVQLGKVQEAIAHWEQTLRIKPDYAKAHYRLGVALEQVGRVQEAIGHYEQALRIRPDFVAAQERLAALRARQARRRTAE